MEEINAYELMATWGGILRRFDIRDRNVFRELGDAIHYNYNISVKPSEKEGEEFSRIVTLFDDESTREKHTVMDKWEVITDDERNPDWEGLEEFLEFGCRYEVVIRKIKGS